MFKRLAEYEDGQAAAEFGVVLIVLVPLIFWIFRFADLINVKHKTIEASRIMVWEQAYGRRTSEIRNRVNTMCTNAPMYSRGGLQVQSSVSRRSSRGDFTSFRILNVPGALGLAYNNHHRSSVTATGQLLFGFNVKISSKSALISNPWQLTDRARNSRIDDRDLQDAVWDIYMYPDRWVIPRVVNVISRIHNNTLMRWVARIFGQAMPDLEPRGHTRLDDIPAPFQ